MGIIRTYRYWLLFILMAISTKLYAMDDMEKLIPDRMGLWFKSGQDQVYTNESLYDYIDGGAELFLSYGFDRVLSRTYIAEDQPDIRVDLFDMVLPENAFGVFCHIREDLNENFGQGSVVYEDAILFWKGRYYISITSEDITAALKENLVKLAESIDKAIGNRSPLPEILNHLPDNGLIESSIIYFKHYIWQNSLYYFADENILEIDQSCDAVLARYNIHGHQVVCLMVEYPGKDVAEKAFNNFGTAFEMSEPERPNYIQIEDQSWMGCHQRGTAFIALFGSADRSTLEILMHQILRKRPLL